MADDLSGLYTRLGVEADTTEQTIIDELYQESVAAVLDFTHRDELAGNMAVYAKRLTVIGYNRLDTEGETERVEGNISRYFDADIPEAIQKPLRRYRVARLRGMS